MVTERVRRQIEEYGMIQAGDVVVVGLSGGADSVCLLFVLKKLSRELLFSLAALHVHHGIRGQEADEDAAFCAGLCAGWKIPFETARVDVPLLAASKKMSLEEAGRQERYRQLERYRQRLGAQRIAVAHHQDDQAETVLWNLLRGTGLKGLSGMKSVNGAVIRPLLRISRAEILRYMEEQGLSWREDATNAEDHYTRNRIRHHMLEYAVRKLNRQAVKHICQTADMASEAEAYLREQADRWLVQYSETGKQETLPIFLRADILKNEPRILQRYIIKEALGRCKGRKDLELCHVDAVLSLLEERPGRSASAWVDLGGGYVSRKEYETLILEKKAFSGQKAGRDTGRCPAEKEICLADLSEEPLWFCIGEEKLELRMIPYDKTQKIPTNQYTKWLDYDKIKKSLVFRFRRSGDYFLLPDGRRKTVKAYMIDEKIPSEERDHILVAARGSHVLWIAGRRLCAGVKITEHTKQILQIKRYGGKEDGENSRIDS